MIETPMIETPKQAAKRLATPMLNKGFKPVALHAYSDASGEPIYWRIRAKHPDTGEKWIRPFKQNGNGFEFGEPKFPNGKPIYALHRLVGNPEAEVWIVEGEQKADALNKLGLVACTSGGATSADATDWKQLLGRTVKIWPDNDDAGKAYAESVATILLGLNCTVSRLDVDKLGLGHAEDVIDWLAAHPGATSGDIEALPILTSTPASNNAPESDYARQFAPLPVVQITCAANIKPEPINWLWDGWLARGKLHVFAGTAGTGKTTIAIALAATVSMGGRFPDGTRSPVGNVLIWSGEDSAKDTLIPRLMAAGADLSKVHFIGDVQDGDELRCFDPATDVAAMLDAAGRIGDISLLIVDPIVNAVAGDSHKNGEVRRALQPLVDFGERLGCAVLGISHFSKGTSGKEPLERVTGSLAFGALARIVLATAKIIEGETSRRIFCRAKSNIGLDHGGFEYDLHLKEIEGHKGIFSSYAMWGQAVEGSARELLAEPDNRESGENDSSALDDAKEFLLELLADGELPQKQIEADAKGASHSWRTVERAKKELKISSIKSKLDKCWYWKLAGNSAINDEHRQHRHINYVADLADLTAELPESSTVEVEIPTPEPSQMRI